MGWVSAGASPAREPAASARPPLGHTHPSRVAGLQPAESFLAKAIQLYETTLVRPQEGGTPEGFMLLRFQAAPSPVVPALPVPPPNSQVRHGLMLVGPTMAGKTSTYRGLAGAMSALNAAGKGGFEKVRGGGG
jgi:hypothetical protein